ncbi:MAG: HNH endonuclease [Myxococcales bacterium]|nr:HNH endonuclease [Myxococcales bacterium]
MLNTNVLVLNRHYQPVHVTSAKRAFSLLYIGAARVIEPDYRTFDFDSWAALGAASGDDVVRTIGRAIRIPRVIMLQLYDRLPRSKVRFSRLNIYARDDNTCQYCGQQLPRTHLNLDHVAPRAQGGRTTWENVVCSCVPCNLKKGARTPSQAGMTLLRPPERPRWTPTFRAPGGKVTHREWLPFLGLADASYWNTELVDEDD